MNILFVALYLYVPDEGSLLSKYRDCTTSNGFELYIYIYICIVCISMYCLFLCVVMFLCMCVSIYVLCLFYV